MPKPRPESRPSQKTLRNHRVEEIPLCGVDCTVLWLRDAFLADPALTILDVSVHWAKRPTVCRRCHKVSANHMGRRRKVWV